jgi:WD40 repeat protein
MAIGTQAGPILLFTQECKVCAKAQPLLGSMYEVTFSADSLMLAAGCEEGLVVWNVPDLTVRAFFRCGSAYAVAFHPSGRWLATSGRQLEVWSLPANRPVLSVSAPVYGARVEFSADGNYLLAVLNGKVVEARSFRVTPEKRYLDGHSGGVPSVAFSPDGRLLASASKDRSVRIWDGRSGKLLRTCQGHQAAIEALAFSPNGKLLASGDFKGDVRLWDPESGQEQARALGGRVPGQVWRLQFCPNGNYLFAGGGGGVACWLVRGAGGKAGLAPALLAPTPAPGVIDLAVHPGGTSLVFLRRSGHLYRWDFRSPGEPKPLGVRGRALAEVRALHFDPTGRRLTFVTLEGKLGTWDWERRALDRPTDQRAFHLAVSPDGHWIATPGPARELVLYDLEQRRPVLALPPEASDVWSLAWSPDGRRVAVGLSDGSLAVWDLAEVRARLAEFGIAVPATAVGAGAPRRAPPPRATFD